MTVRRDVRIERVGTGAVVLLGVGYRWLKAGVPTITVQHLLVRNLMERDKAGQLALTEGASGACRAGNAAMTNHPFGSSPVRAMRLAVGNCECPR
jgi:hypothetical protein